MDIAVKKKAGVCHMAVSGEITIYEAPKLKKRLVNHLRKCKELEINLSQVSEIDTAGFQLLMLAKQESNRLDKPLRLVAHSEATLEVLDTYRLAGFFGDQLVIAAESDNSKRAARTKTQQKTEVGKS